MIHIMAYADDGRDDEVAEDNGCDMDDVEERLACAAVAPRDDDSGPEEADKVVVDSSDHHPCDKVCDRGATLFPEDHYAVTQKTLAPETEEVHQQQPSCCHLEASRVA